ncbi:hypothetical protein HKD37_15G043670 [Glycine soja]
MSSSTCRRRQCLQSLHAFKRRQCLHLHFKEDNVFTSKTSISFSDEDMIKSKGKDPLEGLGGPMTRAGARKAKEALQQVLSILFEYKPKFQGEKSKVVSCIMAQMEDD